MTSYTSINEPTSKLSLCGSSNAISLLLRKIACAADWPGAVLIEGQSGSGRALAARCIHEFSGADDASLTLLQASSLGMEQFLESNRSQFKPRWSETDRNHLEYVSSGTLLLRDIQELSSVSQAMFMQYLRAQDSGALRLIATSSQDLDSEVKRGTFRPDLYQYLSSMRIAVPSLAEHTEDISEIVASHTAERLGFEVTLSVEAQALLEGRQWIENVRQLLEVVDAASLELTPENCLLQVSHILSVDSSLYNSPQAFEIQELPPTKSRLKAQLEPVERDLIIDALIRNDWSRDKTAQYLGINRTTLYKKMQAYGISDSML